MFFFVRCFFFFAGLLVFRGIILFDPFCVFLIDFEWACEKRFGGGTCFIVVFWLGFCW